MALPLETIEDRYIEAFNEDPGIWKQPPRGSHGGSYGAGGRLRVSEIGGCPRKVCHRIKGDERVYRSVAKRQANNRVFWLADRGHDLAYNAFDWYGILREYEYRMGGRLRPEWVGRLDLVAEWAGRRVFDVKTQHPNFIRYYKDYPLWNHVLSIVTYTYGVWEELGLTAAPVLYYKDRGGGNPGKTCIIHDWEGIYHDIVVPDQKGIERAVKDAEAGGEYPEPMEPELILKGRTYKGVWSPTSVVIKPYWNCAIVNKVPRCDWCGTACDPPLTAEVVAAKYGKLETARKKTDPKVWQFEPPYDTPAYQAHIMSFIEEYPHRLADEWYEMFADIESDPPEEPLEETDDELVDEDEADGA